VLISEKQIMMLMRYCRNHLEELRHDKDADEYRGVIWELLSTIDNQQSEELRVIE